MTLRFWHTLRHEKHWIGFPIAILFFFIHECFEILTEITTMNFETFAEISEIIGAIILTYSLFFLIKELKHINFLEATETSETSDLE
jgi:hypothetical protein